MWNILRPNMEHFPLPMMMTNIGEVLGLILNNGKEKGIERYLFHCFFGCKVNASL